MPSDARLTPAAFEFLNDLAANNNRDWFAANKERYENELREPVLQFVRDFAPYLADISPFFRADARKVGGSMFRIYRDTRFSKDKSPYKTYTGVQFRHERGRDAHCPGFYLHLQPDEFFMGVGIWHPDGETLTAIRSAIDANPERWQKVTGAKSFSGTFELAGDSLKRAPKGYDVDHPLIDDLKRKDFIAVTALTEKQVTGKSFVKEFAGLCGKGSPLVEFLCDALGLSF
ncbi:MAG: DUF2461 domain-containing protein [Acidobacteriota bacterium]|jgi:uncharacterized protein (TIGR02453 family)